MANDSLRPITELHESGLLWLINRTVFHPRGFALSLSIEDDKVTGWSLLGDGSEVWKFTGEIDDAAFLRAKATLRSAAKKPEEQS